MILVPQIYLVPHSLARKRVWNKKYPICIELAKQDDFMSKAQGDWTEAAEEKPPAAEKAEGSEENKRPSTDPVLYLFGRTGREKEEWFRRMLLASRLKAEIKKSCGLPSCKRELNFTHIVFKNCDLQPWCWSTSDFHILVFSLLQTALRKG